MLVRKWYTPRSMWFGEGEGDGGGEGDGEGGKGGESGKGGEGEGAGKVGNERKFTQKDLDEIINKRFKQERTEKEKLIGQLKSIQESQGLTEAEKEGLSQQIEELQASIRTKEETAAIQLKTVETKYQKQVGDLTTERDTWKGRFTDSTVRRSLTDAAVSAEAVEPSQIVMMFAGQTRLEEVKGEDGKPTGEYITMMKFQGVDPETKKSAVLDVTPAEAFQHMRENGLHKNLFHHGGKPGTGNDAGGGGKGSKDPSKEPQLADYSDAASYGKAYQKWREDYNVDGSPRNQK